MSATGSGSSGLLHRTMRIVRWVLIVLALAYTGIVIYAYPHDHEQHMSDAVVATINEQKLTASDVDGSQLPSMPDESQINATVAGVDANQNGIRDDVELAIFAAYPTSSATSTMIRSAELQYAMDLQTMLTKVFDQNTWQAAMVERERGFGCLYDSTSTGYSKLEKQVDGLVRNTAARDQQYKATEQYAISYKLAPDPDCDVIRK
jgi:hypothetical protein